MDAGSDGMGAVPTSFWRSADAAERLARLDRPGFAAEFLRRNADYRRDYRRTARAIAAGRLTAEDGGGALARRWGCLCAPDPDAPTGSGHVLWLANASPETLMLDAAPPAAGAPPPLDLEGIDGILADLRHDGRRHLALQDRAGDIHIALLAHDALHRPAAVLPIDEALELRIDALRRLARLARGGGAPPPPPPPTPPHPPPPNKNNNYQQHQQSRGRARAPPTPPP
ncbi:MAG: DUF6499 domain-containing protein, partial [Caulobacteraceae bacterium]|nr:DUF6499 domain-containing protein [Caulobacteraceae bacterium]